MESKKEGHMESSEWVEGSPGKAREERSGGGEGSMAKEERLSLKVWVDNAKKRAVLAEASGDFIDVLCSFLTLSLGTIVKLLSKNSGLGSIDNLYDSIEKLDDQDWRTEACRNMVLRSRSVALNPCEHLQLNVDGAAKPNKFYSCRMENCISGSKCYYASARDTRCYYCGELMDEVGLWEKIETIEDDAVFVKKHNANEKVETVEDDGVFVKKNSVKFIITDDFIVKSSSVLHYYDILKEFGIEDIDLMEERTLEFGKEELLNLLKKLLEGKEVLTKICFPNLYIRSTTPIYDDKKEINIFRREGNGQIEINKLQIKLIMNRTNNNVVCAELGEELANQLFSFLTFPLGTVLGLIGYSNSLGCMINLYNSIKELRINCFKSKEAKSMLISPQLPPFVGYKKQMLNIQECIPYVVNHINGCQKCFLDNTNMCKDGVEESYLSEINPKLPMTDIYLNDGFVRTPYFLVTDDCHVTPMSFLSFNHIIKKLGLHVNHLEKREMFIRKAQVLDLLRALLVSKTVLSDALCHCAKKAK